MSWLQLLLFAVVETCLPILEVQELQGSLYRNGPALFEIGTESFNHWFDGQAMLHRFAFDAKQVQCTNRSAGFLRTEHLKAHLKAGRVAVREVGTSPTTGLFTGLATRLMSAARPGIY